MTGELHPGAAAGKCLRPLLLGGDPSGCPPGGGCAPWAGPCAGEGRGAPAAHAAARPERSSLHYLPNDFCAELPCCSLSISFFNLLHFCCVADSPHQDKARTPRARAARWRKLPCALPSRAVPMGRARGEPGVCDRSVSGAGTRQGELSPLVGCPGAGEGSTKTTARPSWGTNTRVPCSQGVGGTGTSLARAASPLLGHRPRPWLAPCRRGSSNPEIGGHGGSRQRGAPRAAQPRGPQHHGAVPAAPGCAAPRAGCWEPSNLKTRARGLKLCDMLFVCK